MSEALAIPSPPASLEQFAAQHGVSVQVAAQMLNEAQRDMQEVTKARARLAFHGTGIETLIGIAEDKSDKRCLSAIEMLGKLAGEFKAPRPIQVSFDQLMKQHATVEAGPLGGITQIQESAVIDVENDDDGDTKE